MFTKEPDPCCAKEEAFAALRKANDELERRIKQLTAELAATNLSLQAEVAERKRVGATLCRRELELTDFIDNATIGLHRVDSNGIILWANKAELELLGYTEEEYTGHHIANFHVDSDVVNDILTRLTANEELRDYAARLRCKDGSFKVVYINSNVFWEDGKFVHTRCFTRDITARKQAEEALLRAHNELQQRIDQRTFELVEANRLLKDENAERKQVEQRLKQGEEWLRAIFDASRDGILVEDNGCIIYVNNAYTQMLGFDAPEELVGTYISQLLSPDDGERMMKYGEARLRGETPPSVYEFNAKRKDGSLLRVEGAVSTSVVAGKTYISTAIRDITKRKKLAEERERFFSLSTDLMVTAGFDGRFRWVSPAWERALGWTPDEITAHPWLHFVHPEDHSQTVAEAEKLFAGQETISFENRYRHKDGSWHWISWHCRPYMQEQLLYCVATDITERKKSEEALRESAQRYRFLGEGIPHQVWTAQPDGNLDYVNRRTQDYFGRTLEQMLGEGWQGVVHPQDLPVCVERWTRSLQSGDPYDVEFRLRSADGTYRWHLGLATAGRGSDGEIIKWFGTNTDIHDQKLAEEALRLSDDNLRQSQKLEAVGQLAGGVAHDFNNLLTVITGYSDLILRRSHEDDFMRPKIEEIKKAAGRAAALTHQLLAFSRKQVLQPKVLDLNSLVTDTGRMLQRLIGEDVEMMNRLEPALGQIKADYGQIEQVLMNLVVNARDAMPHGGKLTIETGNVYLDETYARQHIGSQPGNYVLLAVSDTGCGMDAATQAQIFEPFFTTKEIGKGTGLGLSTVYGIVKQSGGNIWVDSEMGRGTTFNIYLPRVDEAVESFDPSDATMETPQGSETLLIVEDEASVRLLLRSVLEMVGYQVLEAADGGEALQICRQYDDTIHLMVTDVVMPQMGGREVAERATLLRPQMGVLFMSGYTDDAIVHRGVLDTGVAFMEKPFTPDAVARKVREVLDAPHKKLESAVSDAKSSESETLGTLMKTAYDIILSDRQSQRCE